ncbi:hypothetical protein HOP50_04g29300 [Chloropicon primus]|uniref:Uncharacterized protein n=1 Tax=Chloropicon primus TaxID=1764295 RepID=A0A5B8MIX8_9CHLO|nr:hypothetical protein A3770_04p29310 [Chloropicon primus]UPQ99622.1 hypothetical protein HOP50_04g29300 [Chloropicon primus]|eukprot:QDZ20413.1 hypothetical protein A3770_04p29310 [Chloropicon primus]
MESQLLNYEDLFGTEEEEEEKEEELLGAVGDSSCDEGGPTEEASAALRLWTSILGAPASLFSFGPTRCLFPQHLRPRIEWSPLLRVPVVLRQQGQLKLTQHLAQVETFLEITEREETLVDTGLKALVERYLFEVLHKDSGFLERVVAKAVAAEEELYEGSKSKQVYRNLLATASSKLREFPSTPSSGSGSPPPAPSSSPPAATLSTPAGFEGGVVPTPPETAGSGGEDSESEIEVVLDGPRPSLHASKARSEAAEKSLLEMRSRHNRKAAIQMQKKLRGEAEVYRELGRVMKINEDIRAKAWAEKIRRAQNHENDLAQCGLLSSSSSSSDGEVEGGEALESRGRKRRPSLRGFIKHALKRHDLGGKDFHTILDKATSKVLARHDKSKDEEAIVRQEGKHIVALVDQYVERGRKRRKGL